MTSNTLSIAQRAPNVRSRLKTLINNDLKVICRAFHQGTSGTKVTLQSRLLSLIDSAIARDDHVTFDELAARVNNHGELSTKPTAAQSHPGPNPNYSAYPTVTDRSLRISFYKNPFYDKIQTVVRPQDLPAMPQNRHTVKCDVVLTEEQASRLSTNPDHYRIMLYCAQTESSNPPLLNISFPPQIEVKLNDDDVKSNYKGLKNKPGSTKPADLTKMLRPRANYSNKLSICYALTQKKFVFTVMLVRYVSPDALVSRIKAGNVFSKEQVITEMQRANDDADIAAMASRMSLKDPISTLRISTPVRSTFCTHKQCFDAAFYMQLQEQAPTWSCPICQKYIPFESLAVDKYVEDILDSTSKSVEQVTVEPDGTWSVIKDDNGSIDTAKAAPRASYDDDFDDDDLVEIDDPKPSVVKKEPAPTANVFSTPPLSSREASVQTSTNKRPAVIDLTLSDDEEPPRPAKRANTGRLVPPPPASWFPTPDSLNIRPPSTQPAQLDRASPFPRDFQQSAYHAPPPAPQFARTSDLIRPGSVSNHAQWGDMRSPSVPFSPQVTNGASHRGSMSNSPPRWSNNTPQWPRDGGSGWLNDPPELPKGVTLPSISSLNASGPNWVPQTRPQQDRSSDSFEGELRPG